MTPRPDPTSRSSVALYSGGVDSYCMAVLTTPDVLLHVNLGGAYGQEETDTLRTPPGMEDRLITVPLPELGARYELPDRNFILPARNALLALLGAQYGSEVMMGSIAASRGSDKDEEFAARMTHVMQWVWQPQELWNPDGRDTRLTLPVKGLTKARLVAAAIDAGATPEDLRERTFSCYTPVYGHECGKCGPCGRKWAALAANGIDPGFDGREAYRSYWDEVQAAWPEIPRERTAEHVADVQRAWRSDF